MDGSQERLFDAFAHSKFERTASHEQLLKMPMKTSVRYRVLSAIKRSNQTGMSRTELCETLDLPVDMTRVALLELLDGDFIFETGTKREDLSIWRITRSGLHRWQLRSR